MFSGTSTANPAQLAILAQNSEMMRMSNSAAAAALMHTSVAMAHCHGRPSPTHSASARPAQAIGSTIATNTIPTLSPLTASARRSIEANSEPQANSVAEASAKVMVLVDGRPWNTPAAST